MYQGIMVESCPIAKNLEGNMDPLLKLSSVISWNWISESNTFLLPYRGIQDK
jgi:hypothetical protein